MIMKMSPPKKKISKKKPARKSQKTKLEAGRPNKRRDAVVDILIECLEEGLHVETACNFAKIHKTTFYNWCKDDEDFSTRIEFAKSRAIRTIAAKVRKNEPWKILKNIAPTLYKDKIESEVTGKDGSALELIIRDYRED